MKATFIYNDGFDTRRKLANRVLKALSDIQEYDNGTIRNPVDLASSIMPDGRTLIETVYEDGETDKKTKIYTGFFVKMFDRYIFAEQFEIMTRFASMYHDEVKVFRHFEKYVIPLMLSHVDDLFLVMPRFKPDSDTIKVYEY